MFDWNGIFGDERIHSASDINCETFNANKAGQKVRKIFSESKYIR